MKPDRQLLVFTSIIIIFIGLMLSRVMISIGMILLVANAVINPEIKENIKNFFSNKVLLVISSLFLLHLLSGLISEDIEDYLDRLRIKLPYLLLPFSMVALKQFSKRKFNMILFCFLAIITLTCLGTIANYLLNLEKINEGYSFAKVMPTPPTISHIRFSLMIVFAFVISFYLYKDNFIIRASWEKYLILGCGIFLFVFLHILAVRSGLLALYITTVYLVIKYTYRSGKVINGILILAVIVSLPFAAYHILPSFKNKVNYVKYDIETYLNNQSTGDFSDGGRIISIKAGIKLGNKHPFFGVGIGDLQKEMDLEYEINHPNIQKDRWYIPHNQFVTYYAAFGVVGLLWFFYVLLYPLLYKRNYKNVILTSFWLIIFTSFLSEATLEGQIGTAFFLIFILLILNHLGNKRQ